MCQWISIFDIYDICTIRAAKSYGILGNIGNCVNDITGKFIRPWVCTDSSGNGSDICSANWMFSNVFFHHCSSGSFPYEFVFETNSSDFAYYQSMCVEN